MQEKTLLKQKHRTSNIHSGEVGAIFYDIFGSPYQKSGSFLADDSLDFGYPELRLERIRMKKCYQLCATNPKNSTLAICPPNNTIDYLDMYNYIVTNHKFPFDLKLTKSVLTSNGIRNEDNFSNLATTWFDIQYNEFAYNLFSERLKICIDANKTENDIFDWIKVNIQGITENKTFYIPFFTKLPNILDEKNTKYSGSTIIIPCFDSEKISKYSIFPIRRINWQVPTALYVSEKMKLAIQKEKFNNIKFEKSKTSINGIVVK